MLVLPALAGKPEWTFGANSTLWHIYIFILLATLSAALDVSITRAGTTDYAPQPWGMEQHLAHSRCSINISRSHESRAVQAESSLCLLFPDHEEKKEAPGNEDLALLGL